VTEREVLDKLNFRYSKFDGNGVRYARAEHVKMNVGHSSYRTLDHVAVDMWGGFSGPVIHGHEVKTSRADWLTELRDPLKAEAFRPYVDYFWLVVSDRDIVKKDELPAGWGLMAAYGDTARVVVQAPRNLEVEPMSRGMQAALSRAVMKTTVRLMHADDQAVRFVERRMRLGEK